MMKPGLILAGLAVIGGLWWWLGPRAKSSAADFTAAYQPLSAPQAPLRVFHLGHSLVGRDMPAMLAQLAGTGHGYESQLGWGTSLREHWEPDLPINGFDAENSHPRFRAARDAIGSGDYDAVVLTEMVEIKDAIKYHKSSKYFPLWAGFARRASAETRIYLYETWHNLDDPQGWLNRIDQDLPGHWEGDILLADLPQAGNRPAYLIPAGQVMAGFARALGESGGVDGITRIDDLFSDTIHLNDLGAYLAALTHYAVLYHRSPLGLPHQLKRADGTPADAPSPAAARLMQQVTWDVVTRLPRTGVSP